MTGAAARRLAAFLVVGDAVLGGVVAALATSNAGRTALQPAGVISSTTTTPQLGPTVPADSPVPSSEREEPPEPAPDSTVAPTPAPSPTTLSAPPSATAPVTTTTLPPSSSTTTEPTTTAPGSPPADEQNARSVP